jgi:hypothetical protein
MLTDDNYGRRIGALLRAEVAGLEGPPDLVGRLRRAQARRTLAGRAGLAALPAAVVAIAASVAVTGGGSAPAHSSRPPVASATRTSGPVLRLAGYQIEMPAGFTVTRVGNGVQARGPGGSFIVLFVVSEHTAGPPAARQLARLRASGDPAARLTPVTVDGLPGTLLESDGRAGMLWVRVPSRGATTYLVAKAMGPSAIAALPAFASQVRIEQLPVVNVGCQANCG